MSEAGIRSFSVRFWCAVIFLTAVLWIGAGCAHRAKGPTEGAPKPPVSKPRDHIGAPSCSYQVDEEGNLIVDATNCPLLSEDSSIVALLSSSLGRPIFLTHIEGQLYYALDSRCAGGSCNARATGNGFLCPCDSSRYALSGEVLSGPAAHPLRELPSLKNGPRIRVTPRQP